jgi:hypothetical protein
VGHPGGDGNDLVPVPVPTDRAQDPPACVGRDSPADQYVNVVSGGTQAIRDPRRSRRNQLHELAQSRSADRVVRLVKKVVEVLARPWPQLRLFDPALREPTRSDQDW